MTRRATKPQAKSAATLRAEAVLPWGFVAQSVEYRPGYTPSLAPRPRAKRLSANCILSHGLVSNSDFENSCFFRHSSFVIRISFVLCHRHSDFNDSSKRSKSASSTDCESAESGARVCDPQPLRLQPSFGNNPTRPWRSTRCGSQSRGPGARRKRA